MRPTAEQLANVPILADLSSDQRAELADWLEVREVSADTVLAGEGASGYSFFIVADGNAVVTAEGREVRTLSGGDFFGEMALLGGGRRQGTVTTTTDATVLSLHGTDFRRLQQEFPEVAAQIEETMRARLAEGS